MAWRGVAWRGVAWRGVAWRGVAFVGLSLSLSLRGLRTLAPTYEKLVLRRCQQHCRYVYVDKLGE